MKQVPESGHPEESSSKASGMGALLCMHSVLCTHAQPLLSAGLL